MIATQPRMTEEEFMCLPDDGRKYELVDGEPKEVPTGVRHDRIVIWLGRLLGPYADPYGDIIGSSAGFRMTDGNIRCPDISFIRHDRMPEGQAPVGFGDVAPDLCIEIISASEDTRDMQRKVREYFASGAQEVWHMYPNERTVTVYRSPSEAREYGPEDEIATPDILPGFHARVTDLFSKPERP
jgi:Uma2 family endonuclease